jgi:hypothetical protein
MVGRKHRKTQFWAANQAPVRNKASWTPGDLDLFGHTCGHFKKIYTLLYRNM